MLDLSVSVRRQGYGLERLALGLGPAAAALVADTAQALRADIIRRAPVGLHLGVAPADIEHPTLAEGVTVTPQGPFAAVVAETSPHAPFVEDDTRPHAIDPVHADLLHFFLASGAEIFAAHVNHPGTHAQPFFHPAVEAARPVFEARVAALFHPGGRL